jgi:WD40 repeat protein
MTVLVSYARKDGSSTAETLRRYLETKGFEVWLDSTRVHGGGTWTTEIECAIDRADVIVALLTPGAYRSEICRAEHLRALRKNKCVIPILVTGQLNAEIPLYFEAKTCRHYPRDLNTLIADIEGRLGVGIPDQYRITRYETVPRLPQNHVPRPRSVEELRRTVFTEGDGTNIAVTALAGMGGIGKTVLVNELCRDLVVQQAFPDGIVWIDAGRQRKINLLARLRDIARAIGDDVNAYEDKLSAQHCYQTSLRRKAVLIVLDDIWSLSDVEPFLVDSPLSRFVFTTRDLGIAKALAAREYQVDVLSTRESRRLLAEWAGLSSASLPPEADAVIEQCGGVALAIAVVGARLRGVTGEEWGDTVNLLRQADVTALETQLPQGQNSFFRSLEISIRALPPELRSYYSALAVVPDDMAVALPILQVIWDVDAPLARRIRRLLAEKSLAGIVDEGLRIHDLQLAYLRAKHPSRSALTLINMAFDTSARVTGTNPQQVTSQLIGRLLKYQSTEGVGQFIASLHKATRWPWLRPIHGSLKLDHTNPGEDLEEHAGWVTALASTTNNSLAATASSNGTVTIWNLHTGHRFQTLLGHSRCVTDLAITEDNTTIISASADRTVRVWNLSSACHLGTLEGHSRLVSTARATRDGRRVITASWDGTVRIWDLLDLALVKTLKGHSDAIDCLAITDDDRYAVSSSSEDGTLRLWDLEKGRQADCWRVSWPISCLAIRGERYRIVAGSEDMHLRMWDLRSTPKTVSVFGGKSGSIRSVTIAPKGRHAASVSDDTLTLWDLEAGLLVATFTCDAAANACSFPLGDQLMVADAFGQLHCLALESGTCG